MYQLKESSIKLFKEVNDNIDFFTSKTKEDPLTGSIEWDVTYKTDLIKTYNEINNVVSRLENTYKEYKDKTLEDLIKIGKTLRNKFHRFAKKHSFNLKEQTSTNIGGSTFTTGKGEQYTPKNAFGKAYNYYKKLGYKDVPEKIKGSKLEVKKLFETENLEVFQKERIAAFDDIETRLNNLYPLVSNAKNDTIEYYANNPKSFELYKSTEMILKYIKNIEELLKAEK